MMYLIGMILVIVVYGILVFQQPYDPNARNDIPPPGLL
jgi:hypothetical protein